MADALLFAGARGKSRSRAHVDWNVYPFLDLLAPALLLGLWRAWSSAVAPKLGVYFTAEVLLMAYAYFAVVADDPCQRAQLRSDRSLQSRAGAEGRTGLPSRAAASTG